MLGLDDVNGDGVRDLAVGATHYAAQTGYVRIYSGQNFSLIRTHYGTFAGGEFGQVVGQVPDLDGDGVRDYAIGAPESGTGSVTAFSAASGTQLWVVNGGMTGDRFGSAIAGLGDVSGDSIGEVLAGASDADVTGTDSGAVVVLSGLDGSTLQTLSGAAAGALFGSSLANVGDLDGDSVDEFAAGAPGLDPGGAVDAGAVYVHTGADAAFRFRCEGATAGDRCGASVAGAGDVNADGTPDFIAGADQAAGAGNSEAGAAIVWSGRLLALHARTLTLPAATGGSITFSLDAGPAAAGRPYMMLGSASGMWPGMGLGGTTIPLNFDPFTRLILTSLNSPNFARFLGVLDGSGFSTAVLDSGGPFDPALAGTQLWFSFVLLQPVDYASNALPVEITP